MLGVQFNFTDPTRSLLWYCIQKGERSEYKSAQICACSQWFYMHIYSFWKQDHSRSSSTQNQEVVLIHLPGITRMGNMFTWAGSQYHFCYTACFDKEIWEIKSGSTRKSNKIAVLLLETDYILYVAFILPKVSLSVVT